jgi:hypothetical protein
LIGREADMPARSPIIPCTLDEENEMIKEINEYILEVDMPDERDKKKTPPWRIVRESNQGEGRRLLIGENGG